MKITLLGEPKSTQHIYKMTCRDKLYTSQVFYNPLNRLIMGVMKHKYNQVCDTCQKPYKGQLPTQKTCSDECRKIRSQKLSGRYVLANKNIPTGTVGSISEMIVSAEMMKRGFSVFRSLSPSCFCDVIACNNQKTLRVEIRTGYISPKGVLSYPKNTNGIVDIFGIYERNTNKVYFRDLEGNEIII